MACWRNYTKLYGSRRQWMSFDTRQFTLLTISVTSSLKFKNCLLFNAINFYRKFLLYKTSFLVACSLDSFQNPTITAFKLFLARKFLWFQMVTYSSSEFVSLWPFYKPIIVIPLQKPTIKLFSVLSRKFLPFHKGHRIVPQSVWIVCSCVVDFAARQLSVLSLACQLTKMSTTIQF